LGGGHPREEHPSEGAVDIQDGVEESATVPQMAVWADKGCKAPDIRG
jgi:hypothetical protein